ncbi:MAG: U32 family peptidase, partial [Desulfosarcina sp.]|nr:U32 family peptidase [Desulfobacterales bacterium]
MHTKNKIELLAPAGNFEKLEIAIDYGANAVYMAGKDFSLRNFSGNFSHDEMDQAIKLAHANNVKVYIACNIYSRNCEQEAIAEHLKELGEIRPDALIIADPGIFMEARNLVPEIPIHLSTQANTTNYKSVLFWEQLGVKRINAARELSLKEISDIDLHSAAEIEAFVHGAMCISYSGRCLLSSFMTLRDSNRGLCSHPCRWRYSVVEDLRPGKYMPVAEDDRGTYIFNSSDLCMIEHIPEMIKAGITSLKIEGRMKGINYLASTVKVYREAIDRYYDNPHDYKVDDDWIKELGYINNRGYCTGFYFNDPDQIIPNYERLQKPKHRFVAKVINGGSGNYVYIEVRNKIFKGDEISILCKKGPAVSDKIKEIIDKDGNSQPFAQPNSIVKILLNGQYSKN